MCRGKNRIIAVEIYLGSKLGNKSGEIIIQTSQKNGVLHAGKNIKFV